MSKQYDPTNWENRIVDGDEVLQPGTPLTAENMNKLEQQVAELSNERGEPNGTAILDENGIVPARHLPSQVREMRIVGNILQRDALETFEGLRVLVTDATADETVNNGWAEYVHDGTKYVKIGEGESLDMAINWDAIVDKPAGLLDKYTQEQIDTLLQDKSDVDHTHAEFASITQLVNKVQVLEQANEQSGHSHNNKSTLDKLTYSGAKQSIDLSIIEEMENHTHKKYDEFVDSKGQPNGLASLGEDGKVLIEQLPSNNQVNVFEPGDVVLFTDSEAKAAPINGVFNLSKSYSVGKGGSLRLRIRLRGTTEINAYLQIHVDGVLVSPTYNSSDGILGTLTVDFDVLNLQPGSVIELYTRRTSGSSSATIGINMVSFLVKHADLIKTITS